MSNGNEALQYLFEEVDSLIEKRRKRRPDFSKCSMGAEFAQDEFDASQVTLKMLRIQTESQLNTHKRKKVTNGVQAGGWATVALTLVYLIAKMHGIDLGMP